MLVILFLQNDCPKWLPVMITTIHMTYRQYELTRDKKKKSSFQTIVLGYRFGQVGPTLLARQSRFPCCLVARCQAVATCWTSRWHFRYGFSCFPLLNVFRNIFYSIQFEVCFFEYCPCNAKWINLIWLTFISLQVTRISCAPATPSLPMPPTKNNWFLQLRYN